MEYTSTRDGGVAVVSGQAITRGISREGGLFVPKSLPVLDRQALASLGGMSYVERAVRILSGFLTDFAPEELERCAGAAYGSGAFPGRVAPLVKLTEQVHMLELWHGPTCAFKDMALQLLPHLLTVSAGKYGGGREIVILTATSGDTGKAALAGFRDVPGTRILVFYPKAGVSKVQEMQMTTQEGDNVAVVGVQGDFDDTQTGVKAIFTDPGMAQRMEAEGFAFSSANSINWGRLAPQIVYYIGAYCDLLEAGEISMGERVNICVPTGNFGNILAAYYAKEMGLPIGKLICASNDNKVLADFFATGLYDRRRELVLTSSPSMDILISSNLERLVYHLAKGDARVVAGLMRDLGEKGVYQVPEAVKAEMDALFYGGFCREEQVRETVGETFERHGYLCDPHTAVALKVYMEYMEATGDGTKTIIASTANPFKFSGSILEAFAQGEEAGDEFAKIRRLAEITGQAPPRHILELQDKTIRFANVCGKEDMAAVVGEILGLRQ